MNSNLEEQWRPIAGFPNYQVSNRGRVMNLMRGKVLGDRYNSHGYKQVKLKGKYYTVHRLVALAFLDNPNNLPQVDHIDENKGNNDVSNLRWVTASQNIRHSAHQKSCQVKQLTLDGKLIRIWNSSKQIEKETGYNHSYIIQCCKSKHKQAYGYKWEYADPSQQHKFNRPVAALTKDGDLIAEYKSASEAARGLKISPTQICRCLKGTYKSVHGLRFIYID